MSFMTGRTASRACLARSTPATSVSPFSSRHFLTTSTPLRNAQTASSTATRTAAEPAPQAAAGETMEWNTYFAFRRSRRNYERVFMAPCALVGLVGAGYYFAQQDFDPTPIFGMDQFMVYSIGTVAAGVVGLAAGPVVGNMVFRAANSKAKPLVDRMDKEFFKHIVKNRADPSANSVRNPIPDFYGEKIKSVSEYRAWLRKQREYRRKAQFYVGVD
ncbi:TIM23 complex component [Dissophora ornata]|nr:TIM23 complex component [Dissophora ornata]